MNQSSAASGWLSPTRAWRLIECPASVRPAPDAHSKPRAERKINSGTLTHRALERWIRAKGYRASDPKKSLAEAADACASELTDGPPSGWRISRARLVARSMSLVGLIGRRAPHKVLPEVELKDGDLLLRGRLDLLLLGDEVVVVDLKTQTVWDGYLPAWVEFQLTVYAHLVRKTYGKLPTRAEVFSLNRGRIDVPITDAHPQAALEALAKARATNSSHANPNPQTCRFCDRRFICEPHWDVAPNWPDTDAVQGEIVRIETASSGVSAALLSTPSGPAWTTGIPASLVSRAVGQQARLVRVHERNQGSEGLPAWKWTRGSAIEVW